MVAFLVHFYIAELFEIKVRPIKYMWKVENYGEIELVHTYK